MGAHLPDPLVLVHLSGATIGLIAGYLAMVVRKGSSMHRMAGNVFVAGMLTMGLTGAYIATFLRPSAGNFAGGIMTVYLVSTAWVAGRRREQGVTLFDVIAFLAIVALGAAQLRWGLQAMNSPTHRYQGYPPGMFFTFCTIAWLFALGDVRMFFRRGLAGARRIARHLWRMCFTLLFATFSLYPGNSTKLFSPALRGNPLLWTPHILLLASMIYYLVRTLRRKRPRVAAPELPDLSLKAA
ncbi:MAG TPA: hypothetical protein VG323_14145 [Thermoanaerobaculia bacterium]|nr:hypothetical protein [Thermoanaerobaculia bacterium]